MERRVDEGVERKGEEGGFTPSEGVEWLIEGWRKWVARVG